MRRREDQGPQDDPEVVIEVGEGSRVGGREVWRGSLASLMLQGLLKPQNAKEHGLPASEPRYRVAGRKRTFTYEDAKRVAGEVFERTGVVASIEKA